MQPPGELTDGLDLTGLGEQEDRNLLAARPNVQDLEDVGGSGRGSLQRRDRLVDPGIPLHAENQYLAESIEEPPIRQIVRVLVRDPERPLVTDRLNPRLHRFEKHLLHLRPQLGCRPHDEGVGVPVSRGKLAARGRDADPDSERMDQPKLHGPLNRGVPALQGHSPRGPAAFPAAAPPGASRDLPESSGRCPRPGVSSLVREALDFPLPRSRIARTGADAPRLRRPAPPGSFTAPYHRRRLP